MKKEESVDVSEEASEEEQNFTSEAEFPDSLNEENIVKISEIEYPHIYFDFEDDINAGRATLKLVPDAASIDLNVKDENDATGVVLMESAIKGNEDYYLNAMAAGNALIFTGSNDNAIIGASSSINGDLDVAGGQVSITPAPISAADESDEIISFEMEDGTKYNVHTRSEMLPNFEITGDGVSADNAGVYSFVIDKVMIRVNTDSEIIYYRNLNCVGDKQVENYAAQMTDDGEFYSVFIELDEKYHDGAFSCGFHLVMDENYTDIDEVTLSANDDANHTHGESFLDLHELLVLGNDHYIALSYTPVLATNLPDSVEGLNGSNSAYVWAGIIQEIKDGEVINEINITDYPFLYESAVENIDYANCEGPDGIEITEDNISGVLSGCWLDYTHVNSIDYTLDSDKNVDKLLISMRNQCAVLQLDFDSGEIDWILGGKARTLSVYDEYCSVRADDNGELFTALTYAQHYARYLNKNEDETLDGDPVISIFDNETGSMPFLMSVSIPTLTRSMIVTIDKASETAEISDVITGSKLNALSDKYHSTSHCGSVQYDNDNSVVFGWGFHFLIDYIGPESPEGTFSDIGFDDLRQGSRPVLTEYDMKNNEIKYELTVTRSPAIESSNALRSYRVYKTAK